MTIFLSDAMGFAMTRLSTGAFFNGGAMMDRKCLVPALMLPAFEPGAMSSNVVIQPSVPPSTVPRFSKG